MSDKELEEYIKKVEPNFNSHLEKATIEMSNEYYNLLEERMARFINENQELKQKYLNAVADYETTMFEKEQLNSLVNSCQEEIRRLKKQLEEYKYSHSCSFVDTCKNVKITNYNQQKEFIEWLANEVNVNPYDISDYIYEDIINTILSKYKEIIGYDK